MYNRKIIETKDGSHSVFVEEMGETYHSVHGAIAEAKHVYIRNGVACSSSNDINILEMGFGTGLNALLTAEYAHERKIQINYTALEAYPLEENEWSALNYAQENQALFEKLHRCEWENSITISDYFTLQKHLTFFEDMDFDCQFDIIYFDVFGYNYQPHLWDKAILQKCFHALKPNGIWVTYACKGVVTRDLKALGFDVQKLAGPPGKREMTRAVKLI